MDYDEILMTDGDVEVEYDINPEDDGTVTIARRVWAHGPKGRGRRPGELKLLYSNVVVQVSREDAPNLIYHLARSLAP